MNKKTAENGISQQPVKKHGISFFCVRSVPLLNVTSFSTSVIIWGKVSMFTLHCALCVGNVQRFQCSLSNVSMVQCSLSTVQVMFRGQQCPSQRKAVKSRNVKAGPVPDKKLNWPLSLSLQEYLCPENHNVLSDIFPLCLETLATVSTSPVKSIPCLQAASKSAR